MGSGSKKLGGPGFPADAARLPYEKTSSKKPRSKGPEANYHTSVHEANHEYNMKVLRRESKRGAEKKEQKTMMKRENHIIALNGLADK